MHQETQQHLNELACLAQQFAAHGWVVRLELPTPPGAPAPHLGQVAVHRGGSCADWYVLRRPGRHQIQVAQQHGRRLLVLGTAQDVDDALELLRRGVSGLATGTDHRSTSTSAGARPRPCPGRPTGGADMAVSPPPASVRVTAQAAP